MKSLDGILPILLLPFFLLSCNQLEVHKERVSVGFTLVNPSGDVPCGMVSKSSIETDEDAVESLCIMAYRNGKLDEAVPDAGPQTSLDLLAGENYDLFACAGIDDFVPPESETKLLDYVFGIETVEELSGHLPMVWKSEGKNFPPGEGSSVEIVLERLVAKVVFSLDSEAVDGLRVTSLRLCNCASWMGIFDSGSSISDSGETIDGDYASKADLDLLNNGGTIELYALENCQGTLPEGDADVCTYLELDCDFLPGAALTGKVAYRLFLGQEKQSSFNVRRNTEMNVVLRLTPEGLDHDSWMVDNKSGYVGDCAGMSLLEGLHDVDEIYVGESIRMRLELSDALQRFLGERIYDCRIGEEGDDRFLSVSEIYDDTEGLCFDIKGIRSTEEESFDLFLYDPRGRCIAAIRPDTSTSDGFYVCRPILKAVQSGTAVINGSDETVDVYLTDASGNRLNEATTYSFDYSYYLGAQIDTSGISFVVNAGSGLSACGCGSTGQMAMTACWRCTAKELPSGGTGPLLRYSAKIVNDGSNREVADGFSRALGRCTSAAPSFYYKLNGPNVLECRVPTDFDVIPWRSYLTGAETGYEGLELDRSEGNHVQLALLNPSCISLDVRLFQTLRSRHGCSQVKGWASSRYWIRDTQTWDFMMAPIHYLARPSGCTPQSESYKAEMDGEEVDVYRIQRAGGRKTSTVAEMYSSFIKSYPSIDYPNPLSSSGNGTMSDLFVSTLSGLGSRNMGDGTDLTAVTDSPVSSYVMAEMFYRGMWYWFSDNGLGYNDFSGYPSTSQNAVDILGRHSERDLDNLAFSSGIRITFGLSETSGLYFSAEGNTAGKTIRIKAEPTYGVYLSYTPNAGPTTYYQTDKGLFLQNPEIYHLTADKDPELPSVYETTFSTESVAARTIVPADESERVFAYINRNYWMASASKKSYYDTQTIGKNNRWSTMARPVSLTFGISVSSSDSEWQALEMTLCSESLSAGAYTFYDRTSDGYFAKYDGSADGGKTATYNPDGSPRTNGAKGMTAANTCILPKITSTDNVVNVVSYSGIAFDASVENKGTATVYIY